MKVYKGKYGQIHLIASLAAGLSRYHDEFAVAIVDEVIIFDMLFLSLFDIASSCNTMIWNFEECAPIY